MRRTLGAAVVMAIAMLVSPGGATQAQADHCFAVDVEPRRGPVGTEFVIGQGSGLDGIVTLFHEGVRVARVRVGGRDGEEFRFVATAADVGRWRAHLRIPDGDTPCGPNAFFTVLEVPETSAEAPASRRERDPMAPIPVLLLAEVVGIGAWRHRAARA
jgi:hypothetical protein